MASVGRVRYRLSASESRSTLLRRPAGRESSPSAVNIRPVAGLSPDSTQRITHHRARPVESSRVNAVVLSSDTRRFQLMVDRVEDGPLTAA